MDWGTLIAITGAAGVLGGLAAHALRTLIAPQAGTPEDHEERLALLESVATSIQRAEKARRMRELRAAKGPTETALAGETGGAPEFAPVAMSPRDAKAALRARVFGRGG